MALATDILRIVVYSVEIIAFILLGILIVATLIKEKRNAKIINAVIESFEKAFEEDEEEIVPAPTIVPAVQPKEEVVKEEIVPEAESETEKKIDYNKMSRDELYNLAKEKKVKGYYNLKKAELIEALQKL